MTSDVTAMMAKIERQLDDYAKIKEVWQKHGMPQRRGDVAMSLNEVLLHYKGFLEAEKQTKEKAYRGRFDECAKEAKREVESAYWRREQPHAAFQADPAHCKHYNVAHLGRGYTRCADCGRYL